MIKEDEVERALRYLASTDESCAKAKSATKAMEYRLKTEKAIQFLQAEGTMAEKEAQALASDAYSDMVNEYQDLVLEYETLSAKRESAVLTIDLYRTEAANRRVGA